MNYIRNLIVSLFQQMDSLQTVLKVSQKEVIIGNHIWIGSFAHILKGAVIKDNSVVAWRSCVLKAFNQENVLLGGYPAKIIKDNFDWGE